MVVARRLLFLIVFVGLLWLGWRFAHANASPVDVDLLAAHFPNVSLWLVLVLSFMLGGLVAGSLVVLEMFRSSLTTRRYRRTVEKLEAEIHQLRNLPISGPEPPQIAPEADEAAAAP